MSCSLYYLPNACKAPFVKHKTVLNNGLTLGHQHRLFQLYQILKNHLRGICNCCIGTGKSCLQLRFSYKLEPKVPDKTFYYANEIKTYWC